ncbi:MAG TPA: BlaI/MecI/CopY family transcriptional regulator [Thermoanaerobaculia bacterium]|nr:BlaI/MecI/CopY family transcriptional regulator [Thermoanaerobaculia bacterium]
MPRPKTRQELLSPSEWKVFWVLSRRQPLTTAEVSRELARHDPDFSLNDNTVRTFLKRLQNKGYLTAEPSTGRELLYRPSVPFDVALRFHVGRFLDQFALGGREDLEVLRQLVEQRLASPG